MSHKRLKGRISALFLCCAVFLLATFPSAADPVVKDTAAGDANSYLYGGNAGEVLMYASTATGDVNGDGLSDLVIGHDQGGDDFPYLYTGKVYVYFGRTSLDPEVDLGTGADLVINGYYGSFLGNSVACGDINGDGVDDILMGAIWDNPGGAMFAGGVAAVFGRPDLGDWSPWDFNARPPDLYFSSANGGEMCGMSVISGDIDGDGFDDVLFGAHLGNGGIHLYDGTDWKAQGRANQDFIHDLHLIDAKHGWAVGKYISAYDTIYRYDGSVWQADTLFNKFKVDLHGVTATDTTHAWAVGAGGKVLFNGDFNNTKGWAEQNSGVAATLRDVDALDSSRLWAVGDGGTIIHTEDGGSTWTAQASGVSVTLRSLSAVGPGDVWAVGDGGTILHYDGASWSRVSPSPTTRDLHSVHAVDATHVWAVGDGGTILHYDGASWKAQTSPVGVNLRGVSASGPTSVWTVGDSGTVLRTADGGSTWTKEAVLFTQDQRIVFALDATHVWTAGDAATGRAYIVWGRSLWPEWDYYTNPIKPNKVINGVDPLDSAGFPVSLGDLNGDVCADMLIGAFDADGPGEQREGCGEAYVVYGRPKGSFPYFIDLGSESDCTVFGASPMDGLPSSVCRPLKDVNGDRYDDLLLAAMWADGPGESRPGCGEAYVIPGGNLPPVQDLSQSPPQVTLYGPETNVGAGYSVEVLDFNADLLPDIAVGSTSAGMGTERPNCGAVWLVNGISSWPSLVDLAVSSSLAIYGAESNDAFGFCLTSADLDGDPQGYQDLVASSPMGDGPGNTRPGCGEHFVFLGHDNFLPTCTVTNVAEGAVLAGTVNVEVEAYDFHGIDRVEFRVNGTLRHTDNTAPYTWGWDTRQEPDGAGYGLQATAYDVNGNAASDSRLVSINNAVPPLSRTWYLAEGTTAWGFEEYVLIQNPNPEGVQATVTFMKPGGAVQTEVFQVGAESRFTIFVNNLVPGSDVSTRVEATLPVICERAMYWRNRSGGHDCIGVTSPSRTWYLAEGTTAWGFEEYVLIQNPNPDWAGVTLTFMKPGGATQNHSFSVPGESRHTVYVNDLVEESDVSTRVEATLPVICERAMYRYGMDLGHDTAGTPSTSTEWYFAEGTTAWGFDEYLLVQNPGSQQAVVSFQFMLPDGTVHPHGAVVPPSSRYTLPVDSIPGLENTDLSVKVTSTRPVICERAMYWRGASSYGGHDTIGTPLPSTRWYLAEGTTAWGFEEYVLVQNPNPAPATVSFSFMKPDGSTQFLSFQQPGNSRSTLFVNDVVKESDVSIMISATLPVICERAMYWRGRDGGHVSIGVRGY
ncbi:DUF5719 family protein [Candidatus Solincola tengchongensis]|uniref:DUF5719 family protein n=1 Tax=Candidatus Solincola tengchongensis TaxID=2900693 RepID=UPI00257C45C4|nr:DUF5719 family protein [Candidatus Solincola tengchongensis]